MLRQIWAGEPDLTWLARSGTSPAWSLQDGAGALEQLMRGVDAVLCLAGATPRANAPFSLNTDIARAVLAAAESVDHVFLASTMAVYGGGQGPHSEDSACAPDGDYGRSKLEMERVACRIASRSGIGLTSLRLANIVGADMLFGNIAAGRAIALDRFAGGTTPVRSYLDPVMLARALRALIGMSRNGAALPGVLNLATDPPVDMADLLDAAGVAFDTCAAPATARQAVTMDISQARALIPALAASRDAAAMVAAWRRVGAAG